MRKFFFSLSLSVCSCLRRVKLYQTRSEADTKVCICAVIPTDVWDRRQEGLRTQTRDVVLNLTLYWKPVKRIENRCDVMSLSASNNKPSIELFYANLGCTGKHRVTVV